MGISAAALGGKVVMTDSNYTKEQIEANIKRAQNLWGPCKRGRRNAFSKTRLDKRYQTI